MYTQSWPSYRYVPLPPVAESGLTPPFTRLLMLWAGNFDDPLECSLQIVDIQNAPAYEALSYTWGKEEATSYVLIDRIPHPIRPNLDGALRHLRFPTQARRLWVDALCIDQSDKNERARQVRYMRLVYQHAARAIVWLGLPGPGVDVAFQLAARLHEIRQKVPIPGTPYTGIYSTGLIDPETARAIASAMLEDMPPDSLDHLRSLLDREYFERSWCIQEVVCSSWAVARCGSLETSLYDILAGAFEIKNTLLDPSQEKTTSFWNMVYVRKLDPSLNYLKSDIEFSCGSLLNLLAATKNFKATDPRDKLFALYGISDEVLNPVRALMEVKGEKVDSSSYNSLLRLAGRSIHKPSNTPEILIPNYERSVREIYRDFTRFWIRRLPRVLDILHHVQHDKDPNLSEFPTWTPKWFEGLLCTNLGHGLFLAGHGNSSVFATVHDNPLSGDAIQPDVLSVDGFYVDRVHSVTPVIKVKRDEEFRIGWVWTHLFGTTSFDTLYRNGDYLIRALCLTMIATYYGIIYKNGHNLSPLTTDGGLENAQLQGSLDAARYAVDMWSSSQQSVDIPFTLSEDALLGDSERAVAGMHHISLNRCVFVTEQGRLGLGPHMTKPGDEVVVLFGGRTPFIIRRMADHHLLVGNAYVHDDEIMWGK